MLFIRKKTIQNTNPYSFLWVFFVFERKNMKKLYFLKDPPDLTGGSVKSGVRESKMCALAVRTR